MNSEEAPCCASVAEARYRATIVSISDAVISTDLQGRVDSMNPVAERLTGWNEAAAQTKPLDDVFCVVDEKTHLVAESPVAHMFREGHAVERTNHTILVSKLGTEFTIAANASPICDANGVTTGAVLVFRNQSEEEQTRAKVFDSEIRYRRLFESAKDGILILDADTGKIVDVNPFLTELTGYSREDLLAKHLWEIGPFKDIAASKDSFFELQVKKYARYDDLPLKTRDGRTVAVEFVSNVYRVDNQNVIQCNIRDITARKRAEEALRGSEARYRTLFEDAQDGMGLSDLENGQLVECNEALCRIVERRREELVGQSQSILHPPVENAEDVTQNFREHQIGNPARTTDDYLLSKSGKLIPVEIRAARIRMNDRDFLLGIFRDVTERKQAEASREKLEGQLWASQKMEAIGNLAGGVAHDFNNLLSVILSYTGFVLDGVREGDPQREDLLEVVKAADRAVALTRQLLAFSRRQIMQPVPLDLNEIAAGVERMLQRILGEDIDSVQVFAPDLGLTLADPGQIEQVIMNLVVNARDAMPEGGKLTIETSNVEIDEEYATRHVAVKPGSFVQLVVTDTGCGMDRQTQTRIFEPFFTTKEKGKGTGIGLATVYGIVKQSGGNIWVYSEVGKGSTFKIYLPRELSAATATAIKSPTVQRRFAGTETIVVVEDEEALRKVAQRALEAAGYRVLTAANGEEAILTCRQYEDGIHLLLTDVVMPGMSGRVLAQQLSKTRPTIQVLYMSGYTDNAIVHHGDLYPGTHFLGKPFTGDGLTRKVREVLDSAITNGAGMPEHALQTTAEMKEQLVDRDALSGLSPDVLARLRHSVIAARFGEIIKIIETVRVTEPNLATELRRRADLFDYDGMRNLLNDEQTQACIKRVE